jgi:type VI secretion system protein ImpA
MEMARLAQCETSGRARFHRKLVLAEVCLDKKRTRLARAILEELNDQIAKHKLDEWETTDVVGAVWTKLYRVYKEAKEEDKAGQLYLQICHLDPWQTLSCSED